MAAAQSKNADIIPLSNDGNRGTMFHIMLTQFQRAVGVMTMRTVVEIKIRRSAFIRYIPTPILDSLLMGYSLLIFRDLPQCLYPI